MVGPARQRWFPEGQSGRAEQIHGDVAHAHPGVVVGELEHRTPDAGIGASGGACHVAAGQSPQAVEVGGHLGDPPAQAGVVPARADP